MLSIILHTSESSPHTWDTCALSFNATNTKVGGFSTLMVDEFDNFALVKAYFTPISLVSLTCLNLKMRKCSLKHSTIDIHDSKTYHIIKM